MHVLFVHQNFPAQFGHLASYFAEHHGFGCTFITRKPGRMDGVRCLRYDVRGGATSASHFSSRTFENFVWQSQGVYDALTARRDIQPDLIVGHSGFGSTVFLADHFDCPIVNLCEWYYHGIGGDNDYRPGEPRSEPVVLRARARNAGLLLDLQACSAAYSPTHWQRSRFPPEYLSKLEVIFDGIDTSTWLRRSIVSAESRKVAGMVLPVDTKIVTYVSRGFERLRGFDVFMQVAKKLPKNRLPKKSTSACLDRMGKDVPAHHGGRDRRPGVDRDL